MFDAANVEDHVHLRCEVVGYQFPASVEDDWCLVRVDVRQGEDEFFERVDAALEAGDLSRIREWFRALAADRLPRYARLTFTEPCLAFEFLARDDAGVRFAVHLSHELRPTFKLQQLGHVSAAWVLVFHLDFARLAAVADAVDATREKFPTRRPRRKT
jgi:hypothetical protein